MLSELIVTIELFPYHSKKLDKNLLKYNFEFIKRTNEYVHKYLIPQAKKGKCLVIFLRLLNEWEVTSVFNENIVKNNINTQNPTFSVENIVGKSILNFIKKKSKGFKILDFYKQEDTILQ